MFGSPRLIALVDAFHESEQFFRVRLKGITNLDSLVLEDSAGLKTSPIRVKKYRRSRQDAYEYIVWFSGTPSPQMQLIVSKSASSKPVTIEVQDLRGKKFRAVISDFENLIKDLLNLSLSSVKSDLRLIAEKLFSFLAKREIKKLKAQNLDQTFSDSWIFMDRPLFADDNAEHLYRYARDTFPEQPIYYILKKSSSDWNRLEQEGFKLLEFGSQEWKAAVLFSKCVFSSHMNMASTSPLPFYFNPYITKKNVFLRHGVGVSSNHGWLNRRKIDLMCVSSKWEVSRLTESDSFVFTDIDVKVTGLARFDSLLSRSNSDTDAQNLFLVMPTWRREFIQIDNSKSGDRSIDIEKFNDSLFAKNWIAFLSNPELKRIADLHNVKFRVMLHANLRALIGVLNLPDHIEFHHETGDTFQDALIKSKALITDYTSVHFDMAYINRPSFYMQFDRQSFYDGAFNENSVDFDHKAEGFGPFSENPDDLIISIKSFLDEGLEDIYFARMNDFFNSRDTQCRQRIMAEALKRI